MVPRPTSPTSLLWAHELKRQHELLFKRQRDLENRNESLQADVSEVRVSAQAFRDRSLDSAHSCTANATIKEQATHFESLAGRVLELETNKEKVNDDIDRAFVREKSTLKSVNELETAHRALKDALSRLTHEIEELGMGDIGAKVLEMVTTNGKHEGQLRNLAKFVHEGLIHQKELVALVAQLRAELNALKEQTNYNGTEAQRSFTVWKDTSQTQGGDLVETQWSPDREEISREVTLKALEMLAKPQSRQLATVQTPRPTEPIAASRYEPLSSSPLARKQRKSHVPSTTIKKGQNSGKQPVQDMRPQCRQPRRSQRIAHQRVPSHGFKENLINPKKAFQTENACATHARGIAKQKNPVGKSPIQPVRPRPILVENKAAVNRGIDSSSTLSEISTPSSISRLDTTEYAQRQTPGVPLQYKGLSRMASEDPPWTPVISPEFGPDPSQTNNAPDAPVTPKSRKDRTQNTSNEESPPWQAPKFMLPDFLVPPDWYRPNAQ